MRVWVNFKELRERLDFEEVLRHFNVEVKRKGNQHQGFCPLPSHEGKKNSPSFSANLQRGIFQCFGCGAKGNVLEFAALMKGVDPSDGDALRSVAVELQQKFCPQGTGGRKKAAAEKAAPQESRDSPVKINEPLDFELKNLDHGHPYLATTRQFSLEIMQHFGVGYCSRGLLQGRIAIPMWNGEGKLLGYAGRVIDDATITEDNPRYKCPSRRERGGIIYEFRKSLFLYNGHRFKERTEDLIVVEGFPSVWWLTQHGFGRVVATMGADCSEEQAELISNLVTPDGHVWVMGDGDKAGVRFSQSVLEQVSPRRFVRWAKLADGRQPTDLSKDELKGVLCA